MKKAINQFSVIWNNRFIVLLLIISLGLILRLYKIDNPIADWHSFRQADTASVTKVFGEEGINLFIPRYHDLSSTQSGLMNLNGYRFVEFPLYNLLHLRLFNLMPFLGLDMAGRLLSVIISLSSLYLLFKITEKLFNYDIAVISAFLFAALPFNVYFSRVILPEPLGVLLMLSSMYLFILYLEKEKLSYILSFSLVLSLGTLVKPYILFSVIPLFYLSVKKYGLMETFKKKEFYLSFFLVMTPFILWRLWMSRFPEGIPFWKWTFNGDGIRFRPSFWRWLMGERIGVMILGIFGIFPFIFSLIGRGRGSDLTRVLFLSLFSYLSIVATANVRHDYYQTLIIPFVCVIVANGIYAVFKNNFFDKPSMKIFMTFMFFFMFYYSFYQIREFYKINRPEIMTAGAVADAILPEKAIVIAPYFGDTAFLYQTNRKGWPVVDRPIEELIDLGAQYFISVDLNHPQTIEFTDKYKTLVSNETFIILDLKERILE
jgi:hypothetical protein